MAAPIRVMKERLANIDLTRSRWLGAGSRSAAAILLCILLATESLCLVEKVNLKEQLWNFKYALSIRSEVNSSHTLLAHTPCDVSTALRCPAQPVPV
jgi:hypothetical protein